METHWAVQAEKELRRRIARFYTMIEYAAETSTEISYIFEEFKKEFCIDDESAKELRLMAMKGDLDD